MIMNFIYALGITGISIISSKLIYGIIEFDISKKLADKGYKTNYNRENENDLNDEYNFSFDLFVDYIPGLNLFNAFLSLIKYVALKEEHVTYISFTDCVKLMNHDEYKDYIKNPTYLNFIKMSLNNYRKSINDSIFVTLKYTTTQENIGLLKAGDGVEFTVGIDDKTYKGTIRDIEHIEDDEYDVTIEFIKKDITKKMISKNSIYIKIDETIMDKINNIGSKNNNTLTKNINNNQETEFINQEEGPKLKLRK